MENREVEAGAPISGICRECSLEKKFLDVTIHQLDIVT